MFYSFRSILNQLNDVEQVFNHPKDATTQQQRRINTQNILFIWLDANINVNNVGYQNVINQMQHTVNDINMFIDADECVEFIGDNSDTKICMIVSDLLGQNIVPIVHNMFQVDSIFILGDEKLYEEQWIKDWPKVRGIFIEISSAVEDLKQVAEQCEQDAISISFVPTGDNINLIQISCTLKCSKKYN